MTQKKHDKVNPTVHDAIQAAMAEEDFPTLESAQEFINSFMVERNQSALDDFCGLSPDQMNGVLYSPFDSQSLVTIRANLPLHQCTGSRLTALLLKLIVSLGDKGVKLTATGNLPPALCRELAAEYDENFRFPDHYRVGSLRTEIDFFELHVARLVGQLAGLVRRYKGRLIVSQKCRKIISKDEGSSLFPALFHTYASQFNWGYWDGYPPLPFVQQAFLFTLYLLHLYGDQPRPTQFYTDKFLKAFPVVLWDMPEPRVHGMDQESTFHSLYTQRVLRNFAVFLGLAEFHFEKIDNPNLYKPYTISVTATPLLHELLEF